MCKEDKFRSLFLQIGFSQKLQLKGAYDLFFGSLTIDDIERLLSQNTFFSYAYSPSSIIELANVKSCDKMNLIIFEGNYLTRFLPEEITAILLHEIGHAFNSSLKGLDGEFVADKFVKEKGYGRWIISALEKGVKQNLNGFDSDICNKRIIKLKEV